MLRARQHGRSLWFCLSLALCPWLVAVNASHAAGTVNAQKPEDKVHPRLILPTFVPREDFAALLSKRQSSGRLLAVKDLKSLLDADYRRRLHVEELAQEGVRSQKDRFPRDLITKGADFAIQVSADRRYGRLEASYSLEIPGTEEVHFALPSQGVLFESVLLDGRDILLRSAEGGQGFSVSLKGQGPHTLKYVVLMPVSVEGYCQVIQVGLPPFPSGRASIEIPGSDLEVRLEPGVNLQTSCESGTTKTTAELAGGTMLKLSWYTIARHLPSVEDTHPAEGGTRESAGRESSERHNGTVVDSGPTSVGSGSRKTPVAFVDVCHVAGLSESGLSGLVDFRYSVHRAPLAAVSIRLPKEVEAVEVVARGDLFAEKILSPGKIRLILTNPQDGEFDFSLRYKKEFPLAKGIGTQFEAVLPDFEAEGVAAETGYVIVSRLANVQIEPNPRANLELLENTPLPPQFVQHRTMDSLFFYKYLSHPATLAVKVLSYPNVTVLSAVVQKTIASTVFSANRGLLTSVDYAVRNEHVEFLKLTLPPDSILETVTVEGRAVSPRQEKDGAVLVPIKPKALGEGEVPVRVIFRTDCDPLWAGGPCRAALPSVSLPTLSLNWSWLVPEDLTLVAFKTGSRVLRGSRREQSLTDTSLPIQKPFPSRRYVLDGGVIPRDFSFVVEATSLKPWQRIAPMAICFALGGLSLYLTLRFLFYGLSMHCAVLVVAVSYLCVTVLQDEEELRKPFTGGMSLMGWVVIVVVTFRALWALTGWFRQSPPPETSSPVAVEGGDAK